MSPFATRRRAEVFAAVVDGTSSPVGAADTRYDDLLELVGAMRAVPAPPVRPEFAADLRARLVAEAATVLTREPTETERLRLRTPDPGRVRNPRERRLAVAMGGLALVGATATLSVVAQAALPGDVLYPLKRGIESAHAGLTTDDEGKGSVLLASASTRLDEVSRLGEMGAESRETEIAETLDDFTAQSTEASDLLLRSATGQGGDQAVTELRTFTAASMQSLADLDGEIPESAEDEYVQAVTALVRIDDEAKLACPSCEGIDVEQLAPELPVVGTGFGSGSLPGLGLADAGLPTIALPSLVGELPPGSVNQPSPGAGPGDGPGAGPSGSPTGLPTALPTGDPTAGLPLPTIDVTEIINDLTSGPLPLPSVDVTQLLGGVGTLLDDTVDGLLP